jgi:hypothetical protein
MTRAIGTYDQAWNAPDGRARRQLLDEALTDDCELVEPNGRFAGREAIFERIEGFASRFPGTKVTITTSVDAHHAFARYGWEILNAEGNLVLDGIDVVEFAEGGQLRRILMFFGELRSTKATPVGT